MTIKRDKKTKQQWTSGEIVELEQRGIGTDSIDPRADKCVGPSSLLQQQGLHEVPCHLGARTATSTISDSIDRSREFDIVAGLKLPPIQIDFKGKITWDKNLTYSYTLSGGRDYLGYRAANAAGVLWPKDAIRPTKKR